jgi:hypothetical protein
MSSGLGGGMGSLSSFRAGEGKEDVVQVGFDEGILRGLCEIDVRDSTACIRDESADPGSVDCL